MLNRLVCREAQPRGFAGLDSALRPLQQLYFDHQRLCGEDKMPEVPTSMLRWYWLGSYCCHRKQRCEACYALHVR